MDRRVDALEHCYDQIARDRMADLPIVNPAVRVEAVGFRRWEEALLGALVTPWCINLVRLPESTGGPRKPGRKRERAFPAGHFEFIEAADEGFGPYEMCSLFSPVMEFLDQEAARTAAEAAVAEVLEPAQTSQEGQERAVPLTERKVSRRGFLGGAFRKAES